jgi:hypothetical protein
LLAVLTGCATHLTYPGTGPLGHPVQVLGPVTACAGGGCCGQDEGCQWPLALTNPPDAYTYQAARREKAARRYGVPADEVVLGEIAVRTEAEIVGTIRGWRATAQAGRRARAGAATSASGRLDALDRLRDEGRLSPAEYDRMRATILESL